MTKKKLIEILTFNQHKIELFIKSLKNELFYNETFIFTRKDIIFFL